MVRPEGSKSITRVTEKTAARFDMAGFPYIYSDGAIMLAPGEILTLKFDLPKKNAVDSARDFGRERRRRVAANAVFGRIAWRTTSQSKTGKRFTCVVQRNRK